MHSPGSTAKSQTNTLVVGIGGAGTNIVVTASQRMPSAAQYMVANTDAKSLKSIERYHPTIGLLLLGPNVCQGQPTAGAVSLGYRAALESRDSIKKHFVGVENLVVVAGLGGGTGTGAVPVFNEIATALCDSVSTVVVKPFAFESSERQELAEQCIDQLGKFPAHLLVIDNESEKQRAHANQNVCDMLDQINAGIAHNILEILETD